MIIFEFFKFPPFKAKNPLDYPPSTGYNVCVSAGSFLLLLLKENILEEWLYI